MRRWICVLVAAGFRAGARRRGCVFDGRGTAGKAAAGRSFMSVLVLWLCAAGGLLSGCDSSLFGPTTVLVSRVEVSGCGFGLDGAYDGARYVPFVPGEYGCALEFWAERPEHANVGLGGSRHVLACRVVHTCQEPVGQNPAPIAIGVVEEPESGSCLPLFATIRHGRALAPDDCAAFFGADAQEEVPRCFDTNLRLDVSYYVSWDRRVTVYMDDNPLDCAGQMYCEFRVETTRPAHDPSC